MACPEDPAVQCAAGPARDPSPDVSARPYREGDEPGILAVLTAAFERWPAAEIDVDPLEHLRWKLSNHLGLRGRHVVAEADGRIVGTQGTLVQPINVNGRVLLSSQGIDVAVHPQYQKQGVRSRMNDLSLPDWKDESGDIHYSLESGHPAMLLIDRMNAVADRDPSESKEEAERRVLREQEGRATYFRNRCEALVHPLRALFLSSGRSLWHSKSRSAFFRGLRLSGRAARQRMRSAFAGRGSPGWTVRRIAHFDERFDEFWEEASEPYEFIIERTRDYLNWRYSEPRAGSFTALAAEQDDRILGYVVLKRSYGKGHIADLLARPSRHDVVASLLRVALDHFRELGVSSVECWSPRTHPNRRELRRAGFLCKGRTVTLRAVQGRSSERLDLVSDPVAAIHIAMGDTDLV